MWWLAIDACADPSAPEPPPPAARLVAMGSVSGTVTTTRTTRAPQRQGRADPACPAGVRAEPVAIANGRVRDAVVTLEGRAPASPPDPGSARVVFSGCQMVPRVVALAAGSKLAVTSDDPPVHRLVARQGGRTLFQVVLHRAQPPVEEPLVRAGLVELTCRDHAWERAWVSVLDHPWFAVTGDMGAFTIRDVPAGTWTVSAWHETLGRKSATVTVAAGEEVEVGTQL